MSTAPYTHLPHHDIPEESMTASLPMVKLQRFSSIFGFLSGVLVGLSFMGLERLYLNQLSNSTLVNALVWTSLVWIVTFTCAIVFLYVLMQAAVRRWVLTGSNETTVSEAMEQLIEEDLQGRFVIEAVIGLCVGTIISTASWGDVNLKAIGMLVLALLIRSGYSFGYMGRWKIETSNIGDTHDQPHLMEEQGLLSLVDVQVV